jgi:predicted RNA-binding protein with EMAP domain
MSKNEDALIKEGKSLIFKAIGYDENKQYTEALITYEGGIEVFLNAIKYSLIEDPQLRAAIGKKVQDCMDRVEEVQNIINQMKNDNDYHEKLYLSNGTTYFGYSHLFNRFLDSGDVESVIVSDPKIQTPHQVYYIHLIILICKQIHN